MLIAGSRHLHAALDEYAVHYNQHRPHRARKLRPPGADEMIPAVITDLATATIRRHRVLGGQINEYERAAEDHRLIQETAGQRSWAQFWHPTGSCATPRIVTPRRNPSSRQSRANVHGPDHQGRCNRARRGCRARPAPTAAPRRRSIEPRAPGDSLTVPSSRAVPILLSFRLRLTAPRKRQSVGRILDISRAGKDDGMSGFRIEHDSMGEVRVPAEALWGAQTQRAVQNLPVSGLRIDRGLIAALGHIKAAAAVANAGLGVLDSDMADAIASAAREVAAGKHDEQFPVDVFQTGSGTSSNMNANEVIATLAASRLGRPVHPNDHVNASQSSNDVFPSAIHIAAVQSMKGLVIPAVDRLANALEAKAAEFADVVKAGRTHLMDATPVTLGQEFGGYAAAARHGTQRVAEVLGQVGALPLGGTAVGTGINAPPGFAAQVIGMLADELDLPLSEAVNHFEAAGARDALVAASGALRVVAVSLYKIANDLRWMASGPRAGLAEISLPEL